MDKGHHPLFSDGSRFFTHDLRGYTMYSENATGAPLNDTNVRIIYYNFYDKR